MDSSVFVAPKHRPRPDPRAFYSQLLSTTQSTLPSGSGPCRAAPPAHNSLLETPPIATVASDVRGRRSAAIRRIGLNSFCARNSSATISRAHLSGPLTSQPVEFSTDLPNRRQYPSWRLEAPSPSSLGVESTRCAPFTPNVIPQMS